jgi:hypothetical protein
MITGKINLMNLHAVKRFEKGTSGPVECLIIPIEKNKLFVGEKGVYLDIIAFDITNKKPDQKDTHLVKQSFNKEEREKMTEKQLKAVPILGNLCVLSGERTESEPVSSMQTLKEDDGLPF